MAVRRYPFGFVIFDKELNLGDYLKEEFATTSLNGQIAIALRPDTPVEFIGDSECGVALLGFANYVGDDGNDERFIKLALERLKKGKSNFERFLDLVVGRWALVVFEQGAVSIYNDTLALQPLYFSRRFDFATSHLPLAVAIEDHISGTTCELDDLGQIKFWDETEDVRVGALPANFRLNWSTKQIERFYPHEDVESFCVGFSAEEEELDKCVALVDRSVKYWASLNFDLFVALTAGMDTRMCAAAALRAGVDFSFVTYGSDAPLMEDDGVTANSYKRDVMVARQIANDLQAKSVILAREDTSSYALSKGDRETLNSNSFGRHAANFQGMYEDRLGKNPSICFVGTGLEVFKDYYAGVGKPKTEFEIFKALSTSLGGLSRSKHPANFDYEELFGRLGFDRVTSSDYSISNVLFWELRASRFQSEAINCQATAFLPINPLAIRRVFETAQRLPFYSRRDSGFYKDFIQKAFPPLAGYEVNGEAFVKRPEPLEYPEIFEKSGVEGAVVQRLHTPPDLLQLREGLLKNGSEQFFSSSFGLDDGGLRVRFTTPHQVGKSFSNLVLFLRVNGRDVWTVQIGPSPDESVVVADGLKHNDLVEFGVRATRDNGVAWANISTVKLLDWAETERFRGRLGPDFPESVQVRWLH